MTQKELNKIIDKYLEGKASLNELETLKKFEGFTENRLGNNIFKNAFEKEALKKEMFLNIQKRNNSKKNNYYLYAVAASVMLLVTLTIFLDKKDDVQSNQPIIVNTNIQPGTDKATLTLENGSQVVLEKGNSFQTHSANSNGKEIIYKDRKQNVKQEVAYNYLTIPRGGQFFIKLSDGTQVWLNSESQIKYPVSFVDGLDRKVELIYGEAYFDVSPSTENSGSKFMVFNNEQEVEVLGTEFNIKAYIDESNIYTTLVEGKVAVNIEDKKQNLIPGQQLYFDKKNNTSIIKTVDIFNETSWKDGVFSFEDKSLKEMMVVLSRWYDIEVVFKNKAIENEEFIGMLRKNQNIQDILINIKNLGIIKNFEIYEKKLILE